MAFHLATGLNSSAQLSRIVGRMIALQLLGATFLTNAAIARLRSAHRTIVSGDQRAQARQAQRPVWRFRRRPPVGNDPILWREMYTTRGNGLMKLPACSSTSARAPAKFRRIRQPLAILVVRGRSAYWREPLLSTRPDAARPRENNENGIVRGQEVTVRARDPARRRGVDGDLASLRERLLPLDGQDDGIVGRVIIRPDQHWLAHGNELLLDPLGSVKRDLVIGGETGRRSNTSRCCNRARSP